MSPSDTARGRFITLEGLEGAGKTTALHAVVEALERHGIEPVVTREPGGTPFGEVLRELLLDPRHRGLSAEAELLAVFSARAEHLHKRILPALEQGQWVVSDRFTDASYAYQGGGRGLGFQRVSVLEQWLQDGFQPDLTLFLDVPVAVGLGRAAAREGDADRFEQEEQTFFEAARAAYLQRAAADSARFRTVDASRPPDVVAGDVAGAVDAFVRQGPDR